MTNSKIIIIGAIAAGIIATQKIEEVKATKNRKIVVPIKERRGSENE